MLRDLFSLFPAYAGVILPSKPSLFARNSFPRIRGGDPVVVAWLTARFNFSPHTRG